MLLGEYVTGHEIRDPCVLDTWRPLERCGCTWYTVMALLRQDHWYVIGRSNLRLGQVDNKLHRPQKSANYWQLTSCHARREFLVPKLQYFLSFKYIYSIYYYVYFFKYFYSIVYL